MLRVTAPIAARRRGRRSIGFTLIELMVTVTLVGILLLLGLPSFMQMIRNTQVRTVTESLQTGVRTAATEAVRLNRTVVMSFTNTTPGLSVPAVSGGKYWSIQTIGQFGAGPTFISGGQMSDIASGVTIVATPPATSPTAICFNASGRLSAPADTGIATASCAALPMSFDISQPNSDRPLRFIVQIGGQMRICDPARPLLSAAAPDGCPAI